MTTSTSNLQTPPPAATPAPGEAVRAAPAGLGPPAGRAPVDVVILTFNERLNLPHALRSVLPWAERVFVVDSGSTDGTIELARSMGADVVERPWLGYARQKNWALDNLPLSSPWVFILDADEVITPALRDEVVRIVGRPPESVRESGFYVNRYLIFLGKRIQHCGYFPSWNLRLFKRGSARYEDRPVHEHMVLEGKAGFLKGLMEHEDRRGLEYYIAKHNRYSTLEAETIFFNEKYASKGLRASLFGNAVERRRFFKNKIYPGIPGKWLWRFIWMYGIKLGVLDGSAGLRFCLLISSHELFTSLKLRELQLHASRRNTSGPPHGWRTSSTPLVQMPERPPSEDGGEEVASPAGDASANGRPGADAPTPAPTSAGGDTTAYESSPWTLGEKVKRALWMTARATLFRTSFHNWYGWRRLILRAFGARLGRNVRIRPTANVEIPWNLQIGDDSVVGDHAILYSLGPISIGRRVVISQYAHLCAGTHDYTAPDFPLLRPPITVDDGAWIAADAFVGPGVTVGTRAIVGARATVMRDVSPNQIVAGNPASPIKVREG